jgi:predicted nucleic acid-binding protein
MKVALDTNVLAYAEGVNGVAMRDAALSLLERLPDDGAVVPVQVLCELFNVLVRKAGRAPLGAREAILGWHDAYTTVETSVPVMLSAADLATDHRLGIWDSIILSAAAAAECRLLLSEDLQDGFVWRGVTVANPFAARLNPLLATLLEQP